MFDEALVVGDDLAFRLLEEALVEARRIIFLDIVLDPEAFHHMLAKLSPFIGTWGLALKNILVWLGIVPVSL